MTLKIQGHGWGQNSKSQCESNILSTHIPLDPCQSALPFLGYSYFKIWRWKFKVKVMGEVKVESHNMGPTFSRLTSFLFHVNRASHSWVMTFSKFDLENQGSRSWVRSQFKSTMWVKHPIDSHLFRSMSIGPPIPEISIFKIWPWKSRVKVKRPWCCTTTGLDNSIKLHMVWIHPAVSEIWVPQSLAQVLPDKPWFDKFSAHGGQMGK